MIRVISFNIRCCDDPNGNSIAERSVRLKKVMQPFDADLIGLQEFRPDWEKYIGEMFSAGYGMVNIYRAKKELESSPILWKKNRFELLETHRFWLSNTPHIESKGWDELYDCYRMCVHVKLRDKQTKQDIHFLNTHFGFGEKGQVKSVKLIHNYCKSFLKEPICLVGDFNMEPDSKGYSEMVKYFTDANAVTAKDNRNTYHGYSLDSSKGELIDYCFVNQKFTVHKRELMDETVDGKFPSDHYGIFVELSENENLKDR